MLSRNYTKSNTTIDTFSMVTVGVAGTLVIDYDDDGNNSKTLTVSSTNQWFPVGNAVRIKTASTATDIIVA